jgi:hypothetical protein
MQTTSMCVAYNTGFRFEEGSGHAQRLRGGSAVEVQP